VDSAFGAGHLQLWSAQWADISTSWASWSCALAPLSPMAGWRRLTCKLELLEALAGVMGTHNGEGLHARWEGEGLLGSL
jgi:hypothetical protein